MLHTKKGRVIFTLSLGAVYFLLFLLHFEISSLVKSDLAVEIVSYIVFLMVCASSGISACLFSYQRGEQGSHARFLLTLSMRLFYQIPYYYIYYVSDFYTSAEAILLGMLMGCIDLALWYGGFVLVAWILARLRARFESCCLWLSLMMPAYEFLLVIIELVGYFLTYRGVIFTDDIPYFVFGFLYPALMFAVTYFGGLLFKKILFCENQKGE